MSGVTSTLLLDTPTMTARDIRCDGACRHRSPTEYATSTAIVFPYRGLFVRHVGRDEAIAEANQALFFNAGEEYSVSHPVSGGDACLSFAVDDESMRELTPASLLVPGYTRFREQRARLGPAAQAMVARYRHGLHAATIDPLQAETLTLSLIRLAIVDGRAPDRRNSVGNRKLVDRAKLVLMTDLGRRWSLAAIGKEVGCSPIYLTQLFQQVEGVPLYRYQLRLRLAKALQDLGKYDDLTMLALDLGFSSHSHFTSAFCATYGESPSSFRDQFRSHSRRRAGTSRSRKKRKA
jgi:AraC-like DNA-binding protein